MKHEASSRKSWKAGSSIWSTTTALPGSGLPSACRGLVGACDLHLADPADLRAGDANLLVDHEEAPVVEDRADLVGALLAAGGGAEQRQRDDGDAQRKDRGDAPHGVVTGITMSVGSQSPPTCGRHERRRAVRRVLRGAARALEEAVGVPCAPGAGVGLEGRVRLAEEVEHVLGLGEHRLELVPSRCVGERPHGARQHAQVVAVEVVVARGLAQLRHEGQKLRHVGSRELDVVLGRVHRLDLLARGIRRRLARSCGSSLEDVGQVVVGPGLGDGRLRRSETTGTAFSATGAGRRRNSGRSLVARFEVATSGSRSSSAARRLTKVVLAWRRNGGSAASERSSASFSAAIAPRATFAFSVSAERSSRRSAIAPEARRRPRRGTRERTRSSRLSSSSRRVVDWSAGAKYLYASRASSVFPA